MPFALRWKHDAKIFFFTPTKVGKVATTAFGKIETNKGGESGHRCIGKNMRAYLGMHWYQLI